MKSTFYSCPINQHGNNIIVLHNFHFPPKKSSTISKSKKQLLNNDNNIDNCEVLMRKKWYQEVMVDGGRGKVER
jgi:hypothetical protein